MHYISCVLVAFIFLEQDIPFFWELMVLFSFLYAEAGYKCARRNSHAALLVPVEMLLDHLELLQPCNWWQRLSVSCLMMDADMGKASSACYLTQ